MCVPVHVRSLKLVHRERVCSPVVYVLVGVLAAILSMHSQVLRGCTLVSGGRLGCLHLWDVWWAGFV